MSFGIQIAQLFAKGQIDMHVSNQIDQLVSKLNSIKSTLSDDQETNSEQFSAVLAKTLEGLSYKSSNQSDHNNPNRQRGETKIPSWVHPDYYYDPSNPRQPNMRELMEVVSGKTVEELYEDKTSNWQEISSTLSELRYGVIGSNVDTRDWTKIITAQNPLEEARAQTYKMHKPVIDIVSDIDSNGTLTNQHAAVLDSSGNILRKLLGNRENLELTLENFGISKSDIPADLQDRIVSENFDRSVIDSLTSMKNQKALENKLEVLEERKADSQNPQPTTFVYKSEGKISAEEFIKL